MDLFKNQFESFQNYLQTEEDQLIQNQINQPLIKNQSRPRSPLDNKKSNEQDLLIDLVKLEQGSPHQHKDGRKSPVHQQ